jgi:hypothetical protein
MSLNKKYFHGKYWCCGHGEEDTLSIIQELAEKCMKKQLIS